MAGTWLLGLLVADGAGAPRDLSAGDATPITAPWFEPRVTTGPRPTGGLFHDPGLLFINFDGADMQSCGGSDWPVMNCSTIMNDTVLPYSGDPSTRAAVVQIMANDVADYAIDVVELRPPDDVDYDMLMVGDWSPPPEDGGFAGVAPTIDCWNTNRSETAFSLDYSSASVVAKVVGQEAAHLWGLEHVDSPNDLLYPTVAGAADPVFEDTCLQVVQLDGSIEATTAYCDEMHEVNCPDEPDHQNSYQDMMMLFGPAEPDLVAPDLTILEPMEGASFSTGATVTVRLQMLDNIAPPLFTVFANVDVDDKGPQVGSADYWGPELMFPIEGLPDGDHLLRVDIVDQDGNESSDVVTFSIGGPATGGTGDASGTSTSGGGSTTDDSGGAESGGDAAGGGSSGEPGEDTESAQDVEPADGCGCSTPKTTAPFAWLAFLVVPLRRRRKRGTSKYPALSS